jgi:hypothetical protein
VSGVALALLVEGWHTAGMRLGDTTWRQRSSGDRPVSSGAKLFIADTASCRIHVQGVEQVYADA